MTSAESADNEQGNIVRAEIEAHQRRVGMLRRRPLPDNWPRFNVSRGFVRVAASGKRISCTAGMSKSCVSNHNYAASPSCPETIKRRNCSRGII